MSTINDLKDSSLTSLGYSGSLQDKEIKFFKENGATSNSYNEALYQWLTNIGYSQPVLQDKLKAYLKEYGYEGSVDDAVKAALDGGRFYYPLPLQVRNILTKYGATMLLPGPLGGIQQFLFQPGNYKESTGNTLAAVDQQVGLVVDAAKTPGINASQSTSGFQPYLRQSSGVNSWQFDGTDDRLSLSAVPFQTQDASFAVAAFTPLAADGGVGRRLFEFGGNGSEVALLTSNAGLLFNVRGDSGGQSSINGGATATNTPFIATCIQTGSSRLLRVDSVLKGSNTVAVSASTANAATVGNRAAGDRPFNGHQHIQIFGKGAITDAELLVIEKFAARLQGRNL